MALWIWAVSSRLRSSSNHKDMPGIAGIGGFDPGDIDGPQEFPQRQFVFLHGGITNLERADLAAHGIPLSHFIPGRMLA